MHAVYKAAEISSLGYRKDNCGGSTPTTPANSNTDFHSFWHDPNILQTDGRTDGQTEMVIQYRAPHAMHADAR